MASTSTTSSPTRRYRGFSVYGKSKLANILFTRELARRWDDAAVTANSLHPGFVATRFGRDGDLGRIGSLGMPLLQALRTHARRRAHRRRCTSPSAPEVEGITRRLLGEVGAGGTSNACKTMPTPPAGCGT